MTKTIFEFRFFAKTNRNRTRTMPHRAFTAAPSGAGALTRQELRQLVLEMVD